MTLTVLLVYVGLVLFIGLYSHRLFRPTGEHYFVANRSIGPFVLLMSLFGTNMTSFAILGASGEGYLTGIGTFGKMASSSALVVPVAYFFVGTRLWSLGKRHGYLTQVEFFRDRWRSNGFGLLLFVVLVMLLVPYILIGIMAGGVIIEQVSDGSIASWVGNLGITLVVLTYVLYSGMRGTAWVNTFQTLVFMVFGAATVFIVVHDMGGLGAVMARVQASRPDLLVRGDHIKPITFLTYMCLPLSVGMFPHLFAHFLTAKRASYFRVTVALFPLCIAFLWVPMVLLGIFGNLDFPGLQGPEANSVLIKMIGLHAPTFLVGFLAAGVFAASMSSLDSQVLSLGTMFTQDIVRHYGFAQKMDDRQVILVGRLFIAAILLAAFLLSIFSNRSIFRLGVWSFTGFAALFPVVAAALFWRRSTKWGATASVLTVAVLWIYFFTQGGRTDSIIGGAGILPVAVILLASSVAMVVVSLLTRPPDAAVLEKFFPGSARGNAMKIAYIGAGAAGMYCGTCLHDNTLAAALRNMGHDITLIPTYTPLRTDEEDVSIDHVFYGAINVFLQQENSLFRHSPRLVDKVLDQPWLLNLASRKAGSTDPSDLGALTLSVLEGEEGNQSKELHRLLEFLGTLRPELVHLTNSMFLGLAGPIRRELGIPVLCALQGEDLFLDGLKEPFRSQVRSKLRERAQDANAFLTASHYYANHMSHVLDIPEDKIHVVPLGLRLEGHGAAPVRGKDEPFTIGYMARIAPEKGLHVLAEAFQLLAERNGADKVRLRTAGWLGARNEDYLKEIRQRLDGWGLAERFEYLGEVERDEKIELLQSLDVLSVPTTYEEPKGLFILEALANGVPVVQPRHGAFPELLEATGGGLLVEPGSATALADALQSLMDAPDHRRELGRRGLKAVHERFGDKKMAEETLAIYEAIVPRLNC